MRAAGTSEFKQLHFSGCLSQIYLLANGKKQIGSTSKLLNKNVLRAFSFKK